MWSSALDAAVGALDAVDARARRRSPPAMPNGAAVAAVRQDRRGHRLEEADAAHRAVAAALQRPAPPEPRRISKPSSRTGKRNSSTSGSVSRELVMWVCTTRGAVEAGAGAGAAADRLVVLVARVAEGEVVHRALRRRHRAERAVERVGDAGEVSTLPATTAAGGRGFSIEPSGMIDLAAASGSRRSAGCRRRPGCGTRRAPRPCRPRTAR